MTYEMLGFCCCMNRVTSPESRSGSLESITAKSKLVLSMWASTPTPLWASRVEQSQDSRARIMRSRTAGLDESATIAELLCDRGERLISLLGRAKETIGLWATVLKPKLIV